MKQPLFFKVYRDGHVVEIKQFTKGQVVIGREGEVDLELNDTSVSRIHASIEEREDGKFYVSDLGSQSGTILNGHKVIDEEIKDSDSLAIGIFTLEFYVGVPKAKPSVVGPKPTVKPPKSEPTIPEPMYARPSQVSAKVPASSSVGTAVGGQVVVDKTPRPRGKGTFAPPSQIKSLRETIKPGKGNVVELVVGWQDRVLHSYHFERRQIVHIGSHPKNEVVIPTLGTLQAHPLVKFEGIATIYLTSGMAGTVYRENNVTFSFDDLKRQGKITNSGGGFAYVLQQNEVVEIRLSDGVSVWIRYVATPPSVLLAPLLDISLNQLTGLLVALMAIGLFLVYVFLYAPPPPETQEEETEPPRRAQFIYKKPAEDLGEMTQQTTVVKAPEQKGKTVSNATEAIKDKEVAKSREEEGAASEARPNKSKSKEKKLTTANPGKDKGVKRGGGQSKPDAAAAATQKDVKNSGLLGVFAKGGVQEQLNRANQGAGMAGGVAKNASGQGSDTAGSGINPGNGMRDIGQGGNGTATVGIAGVNTKGRGGGVSGYGTGSLGGKKNATVLPGGDFESFQGSIDREAIRRVVLANIKQIRACYEKGLARDPGLYGKIVIQWTIGASGRVTAASTKSTTMNSPEVENCAVDRLRSWRFPEPPANQEAVVSYPFVFQAQE